MIPKIIHYTWFSGEPFSPKQQECIDSWLKHMPDYQLKKWDMEAVKGIESTFLTEALSVKKWAFVADFIRLWAIYHEGGIYLDTDVMVYKSFDEFIGHKAFIGEEQYYYYTSGIIHMGLTSHCFGAEKGHPFIKSCLDYYEGRSFITSTKDNLPSEFRYNQVILPYIQAVIARSYGFDWSFGKSKTIQQCNSELVIYPCNYFDKISWEKETTSSACTHLALGSWRDSYGAEYKQEKLPLWDKIFWRFLLPFLRRFLRKNGYLIFRIN